MDVDRAYWSRALHILSPRGLRGNKQTAWDLWRFQKSQEVKGIPEIELAKEKAEA